MNSGPIHQDGTVTGQVKVEYAFETVRVRIYLPQWGETWFFIDKSTTVEDFLEQVRKEDDFLTSIALLESDFKNDSKKVPCAHDPKKTLIYDVLTSHQKIKHYL